MTQLHNRARTLFFLATLLLTTVTALVGGAATAAATEHQISEGTLRWDVKQSWREYIGDGSEVGDGASIVGWAEKPSGGIYPEGFEFPVVSGSFDDETNTTTLQLGGYVHFRSWYGIVHPEKWALDTKFSDLELVIGPTEQVLRGTHTGYHREDPGGELHEDPDVVLTKFAIDGATTDFTGGESAWTEIPTVAGPGFSIYGESTNLDPTSFRYTGPGGLPDLSEQWDTPGAPGLDPGSAWLGDAESGARVLHPSPDGEIAHSVDLVGKGTVDARLVLAALDAETLEPVGTPFTWAFPGALASERQELRTAYDPATESVFFASFNEGAERKTASAQRAVWDEESQSYELEEVGGLGELNASSRVGALVWNPIENELAAVAHTDSGEDIYESELLHRFRPFEGAWQHEEALLRVPDEGEWAEASSVRSPFKDLSRLVPDLEPMAVARDGSYVFAGGTGHAGPYYPALHITLDGEGDATVAPIDGTRTPRTALGTYYGFNSLATAADGSLILHNSVQTMDGFVRIDIEAGEAVKVGEIVDAPEDAFAPFELAGFANSVVVDPARGLAWATDTFSPKGHRLHAMEGEEIVGSYVYTDFPGTSANGSYSRLKVAPDGSVYLPVKDPDTGRLGYRRLAFTGIVPEVTAQPEGKLVQLLSGEGSKQVEFTVAIAAEADSVQWQRKAPGAAAFADLEGETGNELSVEATPADDGSVYRAKVYNEAGAIVSDEAALDVEYAPVLVGDLANREVTEGAEAHFLLSADANPEAEVSWQRRVAGFWQTISAEDENFALTDSSLTVLETNTAQSGALFRAKLTNAVGTTFSKQAKLTVNPKVEVPPEGIDIANAELEWTGNEELQMAPPFGGSNYFSAGESGGDEATYSAAAGNVRVFQVADGGAETLATYASRAAHVGSGGKQVVRLYEGKGRIEPDGSATVGWEGSFSVNFYGGLVPFTFVDPELEVDPEGAGTLSAEMLGCASSQESSDVCEPLAPRPDVTVATFSGVAIDPGGEVSFDPDYEGVEVEVPEGVTPQQREAAGWGAWPQPFVDFHVETGLTSYWYSSGGFDPHKAPSEFLVDFDGEAAPALLEPPVDPPAASEAPRAAAPPGAAPAKIRGHRASRGLNGNRVVTIAIVSCPAGAGSCPVSVPRRVSFELAGERHWAQILAPKRVKAGDAAKVRAKLSKRAMKALGARSVMLKVRIVARSAAGAARAVAKVKISDKLRTRTVGAKGVVTLGQLRCEGASRCRVAVPKWVRREVAGKTVAAKVIAPKAIAAGKSGKVKLKLRAGARQRLAGHSTVFTVRATLRAGEAKWTRTLRARLKRSASSGAGGGGGPTGVGEPESAPISTAPPRLERPATAVDVSAVAISWHPRDSWIRYASSGTAPGDGIIFSGGASGLGSTASACPDRPSSSDAVLPYEIRFAPAASWYDPASGKAALYGAGAVRFRWKAHTIDLSAADPEIEINGAASRAIFRFSGSEGTAYSEQRADLVGLAPTAPTVTNGGKTFSYALMRGTLTANGVNVFAGFYTPPDNDEFGCVSVSFTTP